VTEYQVVPKQLAAPVILFAERAERLAARRESLDRIGLAAEYFSDAEALVARLATDWNIDIVVLDLALASPELLERLGGCGDSPAIIAIADAESADLAGMALARRNVTFLDPDARDDELSEVLDAALDSAGFAVADGARRDFASISALSREVERIAEALSVLANSERDAALANREVTVAQVRAVIKARRARERYFAAELFSDPAWDMMLDLMAARLEGRAVSVSSLCIAATVPTTTALRWIRNLCDSGMFERRLDPHDARRALVQLSEPTAQAMLGYLAELAGAPVV
jgi:hypothetical protein